MNKNNKLIEIKSLKKYFPVTTNVLKKKLADNKAVDGINLSIYKNSTLGLIGESGCGKSTTGRCILNLYKPTEGKIFYYKDKKELQISTLSSKDMRQFRVNMQMIFQDPFSSLNPRMTVLDLISEPLKSYKIGNEKQNIQSVKEVINAVGLNQNDILRYPHTFSGGQRQRIGIARAIVQKPEFVVCDEPVSALDVTIQSQIINLLQDLQDEYKLTYLFISHDISIIKHVSDTIAVMYLGKIIEIGTTEQIINDPKHPYTIDLINSVPTLESMIIKKRLKSDIPKHSKYGCNYVNRCDRSNDLCLSTKPKLNILEKNHYISCHLYS